MMELSKVHVILLTVVSIGLGVGIYIHWTRGHPLSNNDGTCPCEDPSHCERIKDTTRKEIFVFSLNAKDEDWRFYDWEKVTTVVMVGYFDIRLVCHAHKYGARAVRIGDVTADVFGNKTARSEWIKEQLEFADENYLDGLNFDYESAILRNQTTLRNEYTELVKETKLAFAAKFPYSMVTVDVAWSPACIDSRCYDYTGLAFSSDFLFVMAYDEQSQILGKCIAGANSGYPKAMQGINSYLEIGIPADRLVLGVPWYGYIYQCLQLTKDNECTMPHVPFRGVNCSDAAGRQLDYSYIIRLLRNSTSGRVYDQTTLSPYFNYINHTSGLTYQVWYDDPESLTAKYTFALDEHLRGVGMWNAESVNYTSQLPVDIKSVKEMWDALPVYK